MKVSGSEKDHVEAADLRVTAGCHMAATEFLRRDEGRKVPSESAPCRVPRV